MYGFPFTLTFPDLARTECLIVVGANPVVSKWSFLQVPNPGRRLKEIEARGGKVYFVDPRRTESAKVAGEHVFIRPTTDVFFYLSFLHELAKAGGVDESRARAHMRGLAALLRVSEAWPAERTAEVTGIDADKLREMVETYRRANGAALYCSTGVNMGKHGALAFWIQEAINAVSGNLDRAGGTLVGRGLIDFAKFGVRTGTLLRDDVSRVAGFASVNDTFPGGLLADEILTPGKGQVRALFVTGGNPLLTMPNSARLREAFDKLELLVILDILPNETAKLAHYVLPCTSPLERADLPFIFPLLLGLQHRPYLQGTRPVVEPGAEQRDEATIYTELARASGAPLFGSRVAQSMLEAAMWWSSRAKPDRARSLPQEAILSLLLRVMGQRSFGDLMKKPHGVLRPPHAADDFLGKRVHTKDGRVDLAPEALVRAAAGLEAELAQERLDRRRLRLISRRAVTTHNSWTHNLPDFVEGERNTNYLYMHPADATRAGVSDGDLVDVRTTTGAVRVPVRLLADLMEGTVALPHGWGHQRATGLSVASRTRGVNVNILAADGPMQLDRLSGMAQLTGIVVDVCRADGPQDASDWSGLPRGA
jgi:formate dehydrogenase